MTSPAIKFTANAVSYLFHPLFILAYSMLLLNSVNSYLFPKNEFIILFARVLQFTIVLPLAGVFLLKGLGFIDSIAMKDSKERIGPFIITGILYIWTYLNMANQTSVPPIFRSFVLGCALALAGAFFINIFSKISLHTVGMGGFVAMILIMYVFFSERDLGNLLLCVIAIAGAVGTARLLLEAHEPNDVFGGYMLGFIAQFLAFKILIGA